MRRYFLIPLLFFTACADPMEQALREHDREGARSWLCQRLSEDRKAAEPGSIPDLPTYCADYGYKV